MTTRLAEVREHRLPNGLRVLIRRDAAAPVVAIVTWVNAGYFDETDDIVGIAHVLEHMYFKGTPTRGVGEIARETKAAGGYLNAATIYDHTYYYTVLPAAGFAAGLAVQADAYARSAIDADELRREIEVIIEEAKRKQDSAGAVASETLFEMLHDVHRMRRWRIGREPGLRALTRDDVHRFYRTYYQPSNTILSIVGDVDPDDALAAVTREYGGLADRPFVRDRGPHETVPIARRRFREWDGDISQSELLFGWRTPGLLHEDTAALDILATILSGGRSSRLYRAVRERGLAARVSAYNYTPTELGVFAVHASGAPTHTRAAARAIHAECAAVRDGAISANDVARAWQLQHAQAMRRFETREGQATWLASWAATGDVENGDAYLERLARVTPAMVVEVAQRYLAPDACANLVYRPRGSDVVATDAAAFDEALRASPPATITPITLPAPLAALAPTPVVRGRAHPRVHQFSTPSGLPVLVRPLPGAIAHAAIEFRGGLAAESDTDAGATSLMVRSALKGTAPFDAAALSERAEFLGASLGGSAGTLSFGWSVNAPRAGFADALRLLAAVAQAPRFAADAVQAERAVMQQQLRQLRDDMYRWPMQRALAEAWGTHPYARLSLGTEASLEALTPAALGRWHARVALRGDAVLTIVGDVDPEAIATHAAAAFDQLRPASAVLPPPPAWPRDARRVEDVRDKAQTALALTFPGVGRDDPLRYPLVLLASVASGLGGRFFEELRDKRSLAYTVNVGHTAYPGTGVTTAYIATSPAREAEARAALLEQCARLVADRVTPVELSRAIAYAVGSWQIRQESLGAVLSDLSDAWLFGTLEELDRVEDRFRAVSADAIRDAAALAFDPARCVEGVVRGTDRAV